MLHNEKQPVTLGENNTFKKIKRNKIKKQIQKVSIN